MSRGSFSAFRLLCGVALLAQAACQSGSAHVSVSVEPESAELAPYTSRAFQAHVSGTSDRRVTWSIVGPGSISEDGVYTAPGVIPRDSENLIRVIATSVTGKTAEAAVRMVPAPLEPTRGPTEGGTIVRITGEGFVAGTQVFFGGVEVPAEDVGVESTVLLRVFSPPHTELGPADLEIRIPGRDPIVYPNAWHYGATRIEMEGANLVPTCYRNTGEHVLVDATGDGKLDMVTACYDGGLVVYGGDGEGAFTFAFGAAIPNADYPFRVETGDIDDDNDQDFFVVASNALHLYRNEGNAAATLVTSTPWGSSLYGYNIHVVAADLDGNGFADLAFNDYAADRVVVRMNDGTGAFGPPSFLPTPDLPYDLHPADLNGDANVDLVAGYYRTAAGNELGGFTVFLNIGAPTFSRADFPVKNNIFRIGIGDFDDDGDDDVFAVPASLTPAWLKNNSFGGFSGMTDAVNGYAHYHEYSQVRTGDLDGDGVTDVMLHYTHFNQIQVFYGQAGAGLGEMQAYDTTSQPYAIDAADVTGDGKADLVTASYELSEVYHGQDNRQFGSPKVPLGAQPTHVSLLPKGAGAATAIVAHPYGGAGLGSVSLVDVSTLLSEAPVVTKIDLPIGSSVERVHAADVTGDGLQDVLAVDPGYNNGGKGSVWLLEGSGPDTFLPAVQVVGTDMSLLQVSDIAFSDLDGDGRTDLVVSRHDGNYLESSLGDVQVLWGAPDGFDVPVAGWSGNAPTRLAIADLDADGMLEILATDFVQGKVAVLTVSGRTVSESALLDVGEQPSEILVADLDRDYVLDVVISSRYSMANSMEIDVFRGLGDITFDLPERYRFYGYGYGLVWGDIDGDELEDLAVPIDYPRSVAVLRGHDGGRFLDPELALVPGFPIGVSLADIDGDDLIDLIVADSNSSALRPLANRSR